MAPVCGAVRLMMGGGNVLRELIILALLAPAGGAVKPLSVCSNRR